MSKSENKKSFFNCRAAQAVENVDGLEPTMPSREFNDEELSWSDIELSTFDFGLHTHDSELMIMHDDVVFMVPYDRQPNICALRG